MNRAQSWYRALPRALRALLTINVVFYVLWVLLLGRLDGTARFVEEHVALHPDWPGILFQPWQLVTYNFLHLGPGLGGFIHILINLLWLVWIGREHEEMHGSDQLVALYLVTGVGGGLLTVALHALFPTAAVFGGVVHGASASVLGVMTAVAVRYPYRKISLFLLGSIRLPYLVLAFLALDLLFRFGGGVAVGAHLGGALFGFLFAKIEARGVDLSSWARLFFGDRRRPRRAAGREERESLLGRLEAWLASRGKDKPRKAARSEHKAGKAPVAKIRTLQRAEAGPETLESEVDRILDKISEQGIEALTEEEKRVLEEASRR